MESNMNYPKGSEWRKWDLHFHTPASYDYKDKSVTNQNIIDTLVSNNISVVAVTDHHIIDIDRIAELQMLGKDKITVLPGIEFLSEARGKQPIHFIGIFAEDSHLEYIWGQIENNTAIKKVKGAGKAVNEVYCDLEDTIKLIHELGGVVTIHAGDKHSSIENITHALPHNEAQKTDIANIVDFYELGKIDEQEGYLKHVFPVIKKFIPMLICSDNHDIKNYSFKGNCWIKANPSYEGLKQVINEPRERVYLGENPQKRQMVLLNKSKYISKVKIKKTSVSSTSDLWFDNELDINPGLVAVIGNKGNGKSALADIIALAGNAQLINHTDYVFLTKDKFRRSGLAKHFEVTLFWEDKDQNTVNLDESFKTDEIERVKYLPQKYIETICTSENYDVFQEEINKVVFSHIEEEEKLGKQNLSKLISEKTDAVKERRDRLVENIKTLFESLITLRTDYSDLEIKKVENALAEKNKEIVEHDEYKNENIKEIKKPEDDEQAQDEQKTQFKKINRLNNHVKTLENFKEKLHSKLVNYVMQKNVLVNSLQSLKQEVESFQERLREIKHKLSEAKIEIDVNQIVSLSFDTSLLESKIETMTKSINTLKEKIVAIDQMLEKKKVDIDGLSNALSEVQQAYQKYIEQIQQWEAKKRELNAQKEKIEAKINFKNTQLHAHIFRIKRDLLHVYYQLHNTYKQELSIYEELYKPVLQFIKEEKKKTNATKGFIEFTTNFVFKKKEFGSKLLDFFDNRRKKFDDKDVIELIAEHNLFDAKSIRRLLQQIEKIINDKKPLEEQFRDYKKILDFYVFLWDMSYVAIEYDIKLDGKTVNQLSPGERGALLIIFYLLIDKGDIPLIIDQPEDNLDNESVFEYLVPYIKRAKQRRQIIIVTHNPNIAVVSDAEQVIYSKIDKVNKNEVSYVLGAIEDISVNEKIVEVLEGTFPAFDNRTKKYYRVINV